MMRLRFVLWMIALAGCFYAGAGTGAGAAYAAGLAANATGAAIAPAGGDAHSGSGGSNHDRSGSHGGVGKTYPLPVADYEAAEAGQAEATGQAPTLLETLKLRVKVDPFNLVATVIFACAIIHTLMASQFAKISHRLEARHHARLLAAGRVYPAGQEPVSFGAAVFHFLGEVEAVFGIWVVPLLIALCAMHGWETMLGYVDSRVFVEPVFVVVIMAVAGTKPVVFFARDMLAKIAALGRSTPAAWWLTILTVAPLLGSFITEPAAMTIAAMLLGIQFYRFNPSGAFRYATLGLLFVNISVGGTLTHFAAPPVLMVATTWGWDLPFMFTHFGTRAVLGIVVANLIYFIAFRREFAGLGQRAASLASATGRPEGGTQSKNAGHSHAGHADEGERIPAWVTAVHLFFVAWTVLMLHHPAFFIGGFLFFLAFSSATRQYQYELSLRGPILVGFFLAGLIVHGGLQGWWIAPVLSTLAQVPLFFGTALLSAFNDNAAITYLASAVPAFSQFASDGQLKGADALSAARLLQYLVVAGAVTGGGLTVIANAPNPAGQSILAKYFKGGVSPLKLMLAALLPTLIMAAVFLLLKPAF